jgi:hypothetical protein
MVAIGRDVVDLVVPGLARVLAELLLRLAHQQVEGAFDIGRGEGVAVMPLQRKRRRTAAKLADAIIQRTEGAGQAGVEGRPAGQMKSVGY